MSGLNVGGWRGVCRVGRGERNGEERMVEKGEGGRMDEGRRLREVGSEEEGTRGGDSQE